MVFLMVSKYRKIYKSTKFNWVVSIDFNGIENSLRFLYILISLNFFGTCWLVIVIGSFRQASVALNVWQPEVVRGKQKQIVEQCVVPVESRLHSLEMELRLCKQQIAGFDKAYVCMKTLLSCNVFCFCCIWRSLVNYNSKVLVFFMAERAKTKTRKGEGRVGINEVSPLARV